jgi:hypothetical protein
LRERTRPGLGIIEPCLPSPVFDVGDQVGDQSVRQAFAYVTGLKVRFWSPLRIALCLRSHLFCYFPTICTVGGLP